MSVSIFTTILPTKKLMKFAGVGGLATIAHSSLYLLFLNLFDFHHQLSNFLGYIFALIISYYGQRHWTFSDKNIENEIKSKLKFVVSSLLSLALNALWVYLTVEILLLPSEYAVLGIMFITPIVIFLLLKYWVFV